MTVGEQESYAELVKTSPTPGQEQLDAELDRAGPSGFDPAPSLRRLRIPMLWVLGAVDRTAPTWRSVRVIDRLRKETGADFSAAVLPHAGHALVEVETGFDREVPQSPRFAPGLFSTQLAWLKAHGILR